MGKNHTPLELLWEYQKLRRASIDDFRPYRVSSLSEFKLILGDLAPMQNHQFSS